MKTFLPIIKGSGMNSATWLTLKIYKEAITDVYYALLSNLALKKTFKYCKGTSVSCFLLFFPVLSQIRSLYTLKKEEICHLGNCFHAYMLSKI